MKIPDSCLTEEFGAKLLSIAKGMLRRRGYRDGGVHHLVSAAKELVNEAHARILRMADREVPDGRWLYTYLSTMTYVLREKRRTWARKTDPLAAADSLDARAAAYERIQHAGADQPAHESLVLAKDFVERTLHTFCTKQKLDLDSVRRHLLGRIELGMSFRDYCAAHPDAPPRSTLWKWEMEFKRFAREAWNNHTAVVVGDSSPPLRSRR